MYKLNDEQQAYARILRNLILVDFQRKKIIMRGYKMLESIAIGRGLNE
ncbi:hypothetical protein [Metasolibacillus meyeri]|nr:hypothetical protein [Metasolibacillus meyeri]